MLTTLAMSLMLQLPMQKIIEDRPAPPPTVIVKSVPVEVIKKIYVMEDKFGVAHENENKEALLQEVREVNRKLFQLKDAAGQLWQHEDRRSLESFIATRNALMGRLNCPPAG